MNDRSRRAVRSRLASLAAATVGVALLSGCAMGSAGSVPARFDRDATLSGSLRVLGFGSGADEVASTRFDRATAALDGVDVQLSEGDLDLQQLLSSIAAGDAPDLIYADRDQLGSLAARGALLPLGDCIAGEQIAIDSFVDSAISQVTLAGQVYGIPEFNSVQLTIANTDVLAAAGFTLPDVTGRDPERMLAADRAVAVPGQVIGVDAKLPEFFPLWAKANGVDLLSADGRTANLDDPAAVTALDAAVGLYDAQGGFAAVKSLRDSADFFGSGNQFASGTLGSMWMEQWYVNVLNDVSPDAPVAFDTVRTPDGDPIAFASGSAWAIPAGGGNPAAACRFARVMTETDSWLAAAQARIDARAADGKPFTGLLTANRDADDRIRELVTPAQDARWQSAIEATYLANDHAFALPACPADAEFTAAWQDAVNRVLNGQEDAATALGRAQTEAQDALDAAWERVGR